MTDKRTVDIHIRLSPTEKAKILAAARLAGLDPASWMRMLALTNTSNPYVVRRVGPTEVK